MADMEDVFLGLGGNIGAPDKAMRAALTALDRRSDTTIVEVSSLYRTPPWGMADQPDFLNAVAHIRTALEPRKLLAVCLEIERTLKRVRTLRWGPRSIDMDILIFGARIIEEEGLSVPHPRMAERAFVLAPLAEIAPEIDVLGQSAMTRLAGLDQAGIEKVPASDDWWKERG